MVRATSRRQGTTAIIAVATPQVASPSQWREFSQRFGRIGNVYIGSTFDPCPSCTWTFIPIAPRSVNMAWGGYVLSGLRTVWQILSRSLFRWYVYARVDMQWLIEPENLLHSLDAHLAAASTRQVIFVPDTESYWGVNDRFAICTRSSAPSYFNRAELIPSHNGNSESLLAAALRAAKVSVRWLPTLGALSCCASPRECHARGGSGVCRTVWAGVGRGTEYRVKYIFEAQAAVQNAEALLRRNASLQRCSSGEPRWCDRPKNPNSPHHCVPEKALCVWPEPAITWRALWQRNSSDFYRWLDSPPWRSATRQEELVVSRRPYVVG